MRRVLSPIFGRIRLKDSPRGALLSVIKLINLSVIHRFAQFWTVLSLPVTPCFSQRLEIFLSRKCRMCRKVRMLRKEEKRWDQACFTLGTGLEYPSVSVISARFDRNYRSGKC